MISLIEKYLAFYLVFVFALTIIFLKSTQSFFTDNAASANNTFTTANSFPCVSCEVTPSISPSPTNSPTPTPIPIPGPGDIVINEIFEATNSAEWVELYNKANFPIDVTGWKIKDTAGVADVFGSTNTIPINGYAIIITSNSVVSNLPTSATKIIIDTSIGNGLSSDGDSLTLSNNINVEIDKMSFGNDTLVFSNLAAPSTGKSLARKPNGIDTNTVADWISNATPSAGLANP